MGVSVRGRRKVERNGEPSEEPRTIGIRVEPEELVNREREKGERRGQSSVHSYLRMHSPERTRAPLHFAARASRYLVDQ